MNREKKNEKKNRINITDNDIDNEPCRKKREITKCAVSVFFFVVLINNKRKAKEIIKDF